LSVHASITAFTRRQHGLVTRSQLRSAFTRRQIDRAVVTGRLETVRTGVYRVAGVPVSWEQQLLAACLAAGPSSHASFRAAAALWQLEGFPRDVLELTVPTDRRARLPGIVVHQTAVWSPMHADVLHNIPVTSAARTLCDLTAVTRPWMVERAVDEGLRRNIVTLRRLAQTADALAGRGRRRCTVMREILEHRLPGYHPGESDPEKHIAEVLVRAGLPAPVHQHRVRIGSRVLRIDLSYPDHMVAIEFDSWKFHSGRRAFDDDRARGNELVLLGFTVLRFTSRSNDDTIVDTVRAALDRAPVT